MKLHRFLLGGVGFGAIHMLPERAMIDRRGMIKREPKAADTAY
jgi:hypothetical protein